MTDSYLSFKKKCQSDGLTFLRNGSIHEIPVALNYLLITQNFRKKISAQADQLAHQLHEFSAELLRNQQFEYFFGLSSEELEFAKKYPIPQQLLTTRFDGVITPTGVRLIEWNTTIPAMQAYSTIAHQNFFETFIADSRFTYDDNAKNLGKSLQQFCQGNIAIICREHDSQISELQFYKQQWKKYFKSISLIHPNEYSRSFDGTYRHIFVRSLEQESLFLHDCLEHEKHQIWNPPSAHLEVKCLFAFASARFPQAPVPWTRLLRRGDESFLISERDLREIYRFPGRFVLKKNRSYGGKDLYFGRDYLKDKSSWTQIVATLLQGHELWIVQEFCPTLQKKISYIDGDLQLKYAKMNIDFNVFLSFNLNINYYGFVSRFSNNKATNIGFGGGILPIIIKK